MWSTGTFICFSLKVDSRGFVSKWRVLIDRAIVFSLTLNNNRPVILVLFPTFPALGFKALCCMSLFLFIHCIGFLENCRNKVEATVDRAVDIMFPFCYQIN